MRAVKALLSASFVSAACAASLEGLVYTFDRSVAPPPPGRKAPSVSPSTAGLLLAQRLGLSQYFSLEGADAAVIRSLNHFAGPQKPLFDDHVEEEELRKVLIWIDGVDKPESIFERIQGPMFTISNPPSSSSNLQLALDFLNQDRHRRRSTKICSNEHEAGFKSSVIGGGYSGNEPIGACFIQDIKSPKHRLTSDDLYLMNGTTRHLLAGSQLQDSTCIFHVDAYEHDEINFLDILTKTILDHEKEQVTLVITPSRSKHTKQLSNPYGTYEVPNTKLRARQLQTEAPLSKTPPVKVSSPSSQDAQSSQAKNPVASAMPKTTSPTCHKNETICKAETNNCSGGHGICKLKFTNKAEEDKVVECWACACGSTIVKNGDGKQQTTFWGGPACQKQDVSVPFFLLAGFTIAVVSAVAWAVGLLYSIGQEDLPSVIGAGVAGPRVTK